VGDEAQALALIDRHIASAGDLLAETWEDEAETPS
jgi:hypothetical protein